METQGATCGLCGGTGWVLESTDGRNAARPCLCRAERGKTRLASAILSELVVTKGVSALYADFSDLLLRIQTSFRPDADTSKESVLTPYADAELLVLDELGASKPHAWVLDVLYNLLNTRYNRKRITIATSNFEDAP